MRKTVRPRAASAQNGHQAQMLPASDQKAAAQARFDRIHGELAASLGSLEAATEAFVLALENKDWQMLGYHSIEAWRLDVLGDFVKMEASLRKKITASLTASGRTTREIAAATGESRSTIGRDQAEACVPYGTQESPEKDDHAGLSGAPHGAQARNLRQQAAKAREAGHRARRAAPAPVPDDQDPDREIPGDPPSHDMDARELLKSIGDYLETLGLLDLSGAPDEDRDEFSRDASDLINKLRAWRLRVIRERSAGPPQW